MGQVGRQVRRGPESWPRDEVFGWSREEPTRGSIRTIEARPTWARRSASDSDEEAVVAGTLRSPWKWEELIVESAVVGGRTRADGKGRWRRRLDGLAAEFRYRIAELKREEPESARITRFERDLRNLAHLRAFALPIVDALADWPDQAMWGEWIDRFGDLAGQALRRPARVLQTLAELRPMADVGPVSLDEARDVLHDRLVSLDWEPPLRRYGRLFVGTPLQARGRSFRVVFVPGLAERVVPQRPREDPLLLDAVRDGIPGTPLARQDDRAAAERLLLKIAIGAASERLYLSYPRLDVAETRARVPSFYALDVMRAITGTIPDHRVLAADAAAGVRREPGVAGASRSRSRDRRPGTRPLVVEAAPRLARSRVGQGPRPLPARAERGAAPLGHQPVGPRPHRLVVERWSDGQHGRRPKSAAGAPAGPTPVFALRAAAFRELSVPVPARDDSSAGTVGRARACRPHGPADARQPVPSRPGRVLPPARGRTRASSHTRHAAGGRRRHQRSARPRRRRVRGETRPRDRSRLAGRDRRPAAGSRHLGAEARGRGGLAARVVRVQLRAERRRARSAQPAGSHHRRRALRAPRIGRSDRASSAVRRPADHRSQDRQEPVESGS